MARIPPLPYDEMPPESRVQIQEQIDKHGRATNMKRTLAHAPAALFTLMEWYPLHAKVEAFLGKRLTTLFAHAVSSQTDCLICSTFFRRWLIESGEDPDALVLDEREQAVVEFGRRMAHDSNSVSDDVYAAVAARLTPPQIVLLTTFGAMMIATNIFNNVLEVDLDEYLQPFRKGASQ